MLELSNVGFVPNWAGNLPLWDRLRRWVAAHQLRCHDDALVVVVHGVGPIAQAIRHAQARTVEGKQTLVLGVMRDTESKDWHLCISRSGRDVTWVAAHPSHQQITTLIEWVSYAAQQNDLQDEVAYAAFLGEVASWGTGSG